VHSEQVLSEVKSARLLFAIGKANVMDTLEAAIAGSIARMSDRSPV